MTMDGLDRTMAALVDALRQKQLAYPLRITVKSADGQELVYLAFSDVDSTDGNAVFANRQCSVVRLYLGRRRYC